MLHITYDPAKRQKPLEERGLDFERAGEILDGLQYSFEDERQDYGENV